MAKWLSRKEKYEGKERRERRDEGGFRLAELIKGSIYHKGNSEGKGLQT
jgi:hypothetical protein